MILNSHDRWMNAMVKVCLSKLNGWICVLCSLWIDPLNSYLKDNGINAQIHIYLPLSLQLQKFERLALFETYQISTFSKQINEINVLNIYFEYDEWQIFSISCTIHIKSFAYICFPKLVDMFQCVLHLLT